MGADLEIVDVPSEGQLLHAVIALANGPAKRTLGLLPNEGFVDRARKGTLLAAVSEERLLGYVLYDLPRQEVKIVHLCVADGSKRSGVGRKLMSKVIGRHEDRERVILYCRHDYDNATALWEALEFIPRGSRPGRSKEGHQLTIWVREYGHPTLFDLVEEPRSLVALDHNVFLDLNLDSQQRPEGSESRYLLADWIGEYVELCITDEVFVEINRLEDPHERNVERGWAVQYRQLTSKGRDLTDLAATVAREAPKAGTSDHRHIARAVAGGAEYFVTRDAILLAAREGIEASVGICVLRPEGLIVRLDRLRADDPYRPIALRGTEFQHSSPSDDQHQAVMMSLLNYGSGEKLAELGSMLRPLFADREHHDVQIVQGRDGRIVGGFARRKSGGVLQVPFIRVAPGSPASHVIARQLVFEQRRRAAELGLSEVRLSDRHLSREVRGALGDEHFVLVGGEWTCKVQIGVLNVDDAEYSGQRTAAAAFDYESSHWPVKITGGGIPTFMIPIKVPFAEALLDVWPAGQSLLPRDLGLGLLREHVYYRKVQNAREIAPGARILWYVATDANSRGSIRAISQVAEVVVGRPKTLFARFERFGVYSEEQVSSLADGNGQVMAIRFTNTEVFDRPADLDELKELWAENGSEFIAPQSPTVVGEHMFCRLYERSSGYAS